MCLSWQWQHKSRGRWKCKRDPHPQNQEERKEGWGEWRGNWNVNARYSTISPVQSKVSVRLHDLKMTLFLLLYNVLVWIISPFSLSYYYTLIMQSEIDFLCHVYALIGVKQGMCTCSITMCWHMTVEQKHPESLSQTKRASRDNITIESHCAQQWKHSHHFNLYKLFMAPQKEDIVVTVCVWALIIILSPCKHTVLLIIQRKNLFSGDMVVCCVNEPERERAPCQTHLQWLSCCTTTKIV